MAIYQQLTLLDFLVMILYVIVLVSLGALISFRKRRSGEHLFLAQHSLGWPSIGLTMWGTNVGPSMLITSASIAYTTGIVAGNFSWYAFPFILLLAMVFGPHYLGSRIESLPQFVGKRYNELTRELLAWYFLVVILVSWLALTLYAGGLLVSQIMNWKLWISVTVLVAISAFFTIAGGLKTVAYTNVFQMSLLIIACSAMTIIGLYKVGGVTNLIESVQEDYWVLFKPADNPEYPWYAIILGYPVLGIWFWCTDQSMVQSFLGARNLTQGQMGSNFAAWLKILDVPLFFLPGIICFVLFPRLEDPNQAYMTMVSNLLPPGMIGLTITVLMAALISTVASALNALSTLFTLDIYTKRFESSQREIVFLGRMITLGGALISIFLALLIAGVKGIDLFSLFQAILGFLAPPISAVFLMGVIWKRASPQAANIILTAGTILSLGIGVCFLAHFPSREFWPHFLFLSFLIFTGLCLAMIAVSLLTSAKARTALVIQKNSHQGFAKTLPRVKWLWGLLVAVMIFLYLVFNCIVGT